MNSEILNQLTNLEKDFANELKPKRTRKKKDETLPTITEEENEDITEKKNRLITCVLSGNSKQYLGKEYTEQQIREMDSDTVNTLSTRYESYLSGQMTKSLGKSLINLYSNIACGVLGISNQQSLNNDLESDPFLNTALQRFTCDMYYRFGALLAPVSVAMITGRHYVKNSSAINNDRTTNNRTTNSGITKSNKTEESLES